MEEKVVKILNEMSEYLSIAQMKKLQEVMLKVCAENEADKVEIPNKDFLEMFLDAKKIEGCSERTLQYYRVQWSIYFPKWEILCEKLQPKRYGHIWLIIRKTAIVLMLPLIIFEEIYQAFFHGLRKKIIF